MENVILLEPRGYVGKYLVTYSQKKSKWIDYHSNLLSIDAKLWNEPRQDMKDTTSIKERFLCQCLCWWWKLRIIRLRREMERLKVRYMHHASRINVHVASQMNLPRNVPHEWEPTPAESWRQTPRSHPPSHPNCWLWIQSISLLPHRGHEGSGGCGRLESAVTRDFIGLFVTV